MRSKMLKILYSYPTWLIPRTNLNGQLPGLLTPGPGPGPRLGLRTPGVSGKPSQLVIAFRATRPGFDHSLCPVNKYSALTGVL